MVRYVLASIVLCAGLIAHLNGAVAQELKSNRCYAVVQSSLNETYLKDYVLKALQAAPTQILNPGTVYRIDYDINSTCDSDCRPRINSHSLSHHAFIGEASAPRSQKKVGNTAVRYFPCGDARVIAVSFVVPKPEKLGRPTGDVSNVTVALCPSRKRGHYDLRKLKCATHQIRVRNNTSVYGWQIEPPRPRHRSLSSRPNSVPANRPITLSTFISNRTGQAYWITGNEIVRLRQVLGPRPAGSSQVIASLPLPPLGTNDRGPVDFQVGPFAPGSYGFRACLFGMTNSENWPVREICSEATAVNVGNPDAAALTISTVIHEIPSTTIIPEQTRFRVRASIRNSSASDNPRGARYFLIHSTPTGGIGAVASYRNLEPLPSGLSRTPTFDMAGLAAGTYDFRACATDNISAGLQDMVCGSPSPFVVVQQRVRPTPPPATPIANTCTGGRRATSEGRCVCPAGTYWNTRGNRDYCARCGSGTGLSCASASESTARRCTGGRVKSSSGRCTCPNGTFWNPNPGFNRCYTCTRGRQWDRSQRRCVCPTGTRWDGTSNRCARQAVRRCPPPFAYNPASGQCICRPGLQRVGNSCRRKQSDSTSTPSVRKCAAPFVRNPASGRCVCRQGYRQVGNTCRKQSQSNTLPSARECRSPFVLNPVSGRCVCRPGLRRVGNTCRKQSQSNTLPSARKCRSPFVRNPASGQCVCRPGFRRVGSNCQRKAQSNTRPSARKCRAPFVRNPASGRCICRPGFTKVGNSCRRKSKQSAPRRPVKIERLRCIGGKVKGRLCWCGIGKFPKRVSGNTYRCR